MYVQYMICFPQKREWDILSVLNEEDKPGKEFSFPEFNKGNFQCVESQN